MLIFVNSVGTVEAKKLGIINGCDIKNKTSA